MQRIRRISELPPDLRELAEANRVNQNPSDNSTDEISAAFAWEDTPEGYIFWETIYEGEGNGKNYQEDDQILM